MLRVLTAPHKSGLSSQLPLQLGCRIHQSDRAVRGLSSEASGVWEQARRAGTGSVWLALGRQMHLVSGDVRGVGGLPGPAPRAGGPSVERAVLPTSGRGVI